MKACGIVAEYNPLHTGHVYQMNKARQISQADCIIVVMSGNFVQRGEPAVRYVFNLSCSSDISIFLIPNALAYSAVSVSSL